MLARLVQVEELPPSMVSITTSADILEKHNIDMVCECWHTWEPQIQVERRHDLWSHFELKKLDTIVSLPDFQKVQDERAYS